MNSRLILEKRFNNEILLINPNRKIINKKKANEKNPFYISTIPFKEAIRNKKTGFIKQKELKNLICEKSKQKLNFIEYHKQFFSKIQKSDFYEDLEIINSEINLNQSKNSKKSPSSSDIQKNFISPLTTAIKNVNSSIWKNCFLINSTSCSDLISPLQKFQDSNPTKKVLILDWGVTHNPAIQSAFYDDPRSLIISIHSSNLSLRESSPLSRSWKLEALGNGRGKGFNLNLPLKVDPGDFFEDSRYLFIFERAVFPIIKSFQPDLVIIMNSLDCLYGDKFGNLQLSGNCKQNDHLI
jgi:hypothetical protein